MKVLKITGDYQERRLWFNNAFEGYVTYDEESMLLLGYMCRNPGYSAIMTTSYIIGSYDTNTHELELLEVHTDSNKEEEDTLFIFDDVRNEGIWGQCDLKYDYFSVVGSARLRLEETDEQRVKDVERAVEYLEQEINDAYAYRVIDDYQSMVHSVFAGVFRDYFNG